MIRKMQIQVVLTKDNKLVILEDFHDFTMESIENQLIVIGILDNLKQRHLEAINLLFTKSAKGGSQ